MSYQTAKDGREFVRVEGFGFPIWRKAGENVEETIARGEGIAQRAAEKAAATRARKSGRQPSESASARIIADMAGAEPPPRASDPPPKVPPGKIEGPSEGVSDAELQRSLAELLSMPAIPADFVLGCEYCAQHFADEGPKVAAHLVMMARTRPPLRRALVRIHRALNEITIVAVLAGYLGKPILHHAAPAPVLAAVGPILGVPPRPSMAGHPSVMRVPFAMPPIPEHEHEHEHEFIDPNQPSIAVTDAEPSPPADDTDEPDADAA